MRTTETALREVLAERASEGELYEKMPADWVSCTACGHRCRIPPGKPGVCKVRFNRDGKLFVPRGYVSTLQVDPIEKKPFHHVLPGAQVLSFGMLGCDYHCSFCQNWLTSQSLRDPAAGIRPSDIPAEEIITCATTQRTEVIASTYNEPLITSEWAVEVFKMARPCGLRCAYVSNGNATLEALEYMRPWVDCCNIDLKSFRDRRYRELGGVLDRVLATIQQAHEMGFWIEVVTLIVPGFNDS
ncbi:MAG: radical SAM protein, partial [Planctomycetota bacterium]|nr:radical SAM protein [Planctomycetota bacterium]